VQAALVIPGTICCADDACRNWQETPVETNYLPVKTAHEGV